MSSLIPIFPEVQQEYLIPCLNLYDLYKLDRDLFFIRVKESPNELEEAITTALELLDEEFIVFLREHKMFPSEEVLDYFHRFLDSNNRELLKILFRQEPECILDEFLDSEDLEIVFGRFLLLSGIYHDYLPYTLNHVAMMNVEDLPPIFDELVNKEGSIPRVILDVVGLESHFYEYFPNDFWPLAEDIDMWQKYVGYRKNQRELSTFYEEEELESLRHRLRSQKIDNPKHTI